MLNTFRQEHNITVCHGSPQTPTTQGLVERSNRTWKENMRAIILSSENKSIGEWCKSTLQASYTMNITFHRAINCFPCEAVFGFKAHRAVAASAILANEEEVSPEMAENVREIPDTINLEQLAKCQKISENQQRYNAKMKNQTQRPKK